MKQKIYKQEIAGYIFFSILIAACAWFLIWTLFNGMNQKIITVFAEIALLIYSITMLINYSKTKIIVNDLYISYVTLFKRKQVAFDQILKIETTAKLEGISQQGIVHAKYALILHLRDGKIEIRIKTFSRKNLTDLAQLIISKCPSAEINSQTHKMAEGKMPSAFFKS